MKSLWINEKQLEELKEYGIIPADWRVKKVRG